MQKTYWLCLNSLNLGQVLDGLQVREDSWRKTAEFLRSDIIPDDSFIAEECDSAEEAERLANLYKEIIDSVLIQREVQDKHAVTAEKLPRRAKDGSCRMFCIYIPTVFQGPVPAEIGGNGGPVVYSTQRAAECEIADVMLDKLYQFLAGERDFEDACSTDEYVVPVKLLRDGSIIDENGRHFTAGSWY